MMRELTPLSAPVDFAWSSYRGNAIGEERPILSAHADYSAGGYYLFCPLDELLSVTGPIDGACTDSTSRSDTWLSAARTANDRVLTRRSLRLTSTKTQSRNCANVYRRGRPKRPVEEDSTESRRSAERVPLEGVGDNDRL
jgi:hypothetical protein